MAMMIWLRDARSAAICSLCSAPCSTSLPSRKGKGRNTEQEGGFAPLLFRMEHSNFNVLQCSCSASCSAEHAEQE